MEVLMCERNGLHLPSAGCTTSAPFASETRLVAARLRSQPRSSRPPQQLPGVVCSTVRKDGSAEARGLRAVDTSTPTLREQFKAQSQQALPRDITAASDAASTAVARNRDSSGNCSPIKTTGLRRTPLSGGVKNATQQFDLPSPAVAVRNLVEQAQFAHLCTVMSSMHHRRAGYPFGTLVDFAADGAGHPIFCMSPLAIHTRNIMEDPRCSLVVQMPGWTGLANARVTIFGDVYQLPPELQETAREMYTQKHARDSKERWLSGNALFFRMHRISDVYFVGGFGTVQWVDVAEYTTVKPDSIVMHQPRRILQVLNDTYSQPLRRMLKHMHNRHASDAEFISIDRLGADVRARFGADYSVERVGFDQPVHTLEEAIASIGRVLPADDAEASELSESDADDSAGDADSQAAVEKA